MEEKKNKNNYIVIIIGAIILLLIVLIIYFCFFNKKGNTNETKKDEPENKVIYDKPDSEYSINDLGTGEKNIEYDGKKVRVLVSYNDTNEIATGVSINEESVLTFGENEALAGVYQIGHYIVVVKDINGGKNKEIYIYNFDGEFQMLQSIDKEGMTLDSFKVNGASFDAEFKTYDGTVLNYNGKTINVCNSNELQSNGISDDFIVYEKDSLFYDGEQDTFFYDTDYSTIKMVSDLKENC